MIVWIIGISGSGKSTLSEVCEKKLKSLGKKVVFMDGDIIREAFDNDLGHSVIDRLKNARRLSVFCKFLDTQGIDVVCSVLSFREETRIWNRENIKNYYEIFVDTDITECEKRDVKGIYKNFSNGLIEGVVGKDIFFETPKNPNLIVKNDGDLKLFLENSKFIIELFI